jgi:transposase
LKAPHRDVVRARIALLVEQSLPNAEIARQVGCDVKTVRKWRRRIEDCPDPKSLLDQPRSGRPPQVSPEVHQQLMKLACTRPDDSKVPFQAIWTLSSLSAALAAETGVRLSRSEVARVLEAGELRPHHVRQWLHSPDPEFRPKVAAICKLYITPPEGATVLCIDEKPGIQALEHRFPLKPCAPWRAGRKEFEYIRHGTCSLLAGLNVRTGEVIGHCGPTRSAEALLSFMDRVAARYPTGPIYIIWDNLNIHHGPRWEAFNARHGGRFHFVYTPLHASWVNQIENWFSVLSRRVLRNASFASVQEVSARVLAFIEHWNLAEARPMRWTFRGRWRSVALPRAA